MLFIKVKIRVHVRLHFIKLNVRTIFYALQIHMYKSIAQGTHSQITLRVPLQIKVLGVQNI